MMGGGSKNFSRNRRASADATSRPDSHTPVWFSLRCVMTLSNKSNCVSTELKRSRNSVNLRCASSAPLWAVSADLSHRRNSSSRCRNSVLPILKNFSIAICELGSRLAAGSIDSWSAKGLTPATRVRIARASCSNIQAAKAGSGISSYPEQNDLIAASHPAATTVAAAADGALRRHKRKRSRRRDRTHLRKRRKRGVSRHEQRRRIPLRGVGDRVAGSIFRRLARRRQSGDLGGVGGEADERLCRLPLHLVALHLQRAGESACDVSAEAGAHRAAKVSADRSAGHRQQLLGGALQKTAERLARRRIEEAAGRFRDSPDEIVQEVFEFLFAPYFHQLGRKLHLFGFAQCGCFRSKRIVSHFLGVAEMRPIDVMHASSPVVGD